MSITDWVQFDSEDCVEHVSYYRRVGEKIEVAESFTFYDQTEANLRADAIESSKKFNLPKGITTLGCVSQMVTVNKLVFMGTTSYIVMVRTSAFVPDWKTTLLEL